MALKILDLYQNSNYNDDRFFGQLDLLNKKDQIKMTDLEGNEYAVSICPKDSSGPYNYELTNRLVSYAKEGKLNYAIDIFPYYSSDASAALRAGLNAKCALIGSGVHASHGMERTHLDGMFNTMKLLLMYLTK